MERSVCRSEIILDTKIGMRKVENAQNFFCDKNFLPFSRCICNFFIYFAHNMNFVARIAAERSADVPFSEQVDYTLALIRPGVR